MSVFIKRNLSADTMAEKMDEFAKSGKMPLSECEDLMDRSGDKIPRRISPPFIPESQRPKNR